MSSQELYYKSLSKEELFKAPDNYAWNCVLYYVQFTQEELLRVREWIDIRVMVKHQKCLTRSFVHKHFSRDVDDDDLLTWEAVYKYVTTE